MYSPTMSADFSLDDRYVREDGTVYLTGIQALVRAIHDRAVLDRRRGHHSSSFISGYEGSPLAGLDLELARKRKYLDGYDIVHRPAVNEELAATSVMGSQMVGQVSQPATSGVSGYWYGKSPGLDRASDAIRHANLIGTSSNGGAVALVGDDPSGKSSTVPCASEAALADLLIPTLYPADPQEVLDYGIHAPYLSRFTGLWSGLKIVTAVADSAGTAIVHPDRIDPTFGDFGPSQHIPNARLIGANLLNLERSQIKDRLPRALLYARMNGLNRIVRAGRGDRVGIVAAGKTYLDVREALTMMGFSSDDLERYGIRILKLGMIYPVDPDIVRDFASGVNEIIVVEEKRSFLEAAVRDILYGMPNAPRVVGKKDAKGAPLHAGHGELDSNQVADALSRQLEQYASEPAQRWRDRPRQSRISLPIVTRTPYFCSGCPHNSSTKVTSPESLVGAGIGCHGLVALMDDKQVGDIMGVTQMGGEGAQWLGMAPFLQRNHFVQNLGDGTFTHSGSLALRAAVASGENITYKLLYNATVAMTGGQDPVGAMSLDRMTRLLLAEGVSKIVVTTEDRARLKRLRLPKSVTVRDRRDIVEIQGELAAVPGVTVLIHDQECAAEKRRKRKRGTIPTPTTRVVINERICEGCGDCGEKSNCLSVHPIETEFGRKTTIHQSSCNVDYSCLEGDCPSFVTVIPASTEPRRQAPDIAFDLVAEPAQITDARTEFSIRILGVGGTGVVTVSQLVATAAVLDGRSVRTLDQTGLAQKGGAVVSDVKIATGVIEQAPKISEGQCDLYLVCDGLVGVDPTNLKVANATKTVAVVSTTKIPTGQMVVDTAASFPPPDAVRSVIDDATERAVYFDPAALSRELFNGEQYANIVLLGAAFQLGALPISALAIEKAVSLNGADVNVNLQAFRRGRQAIADPDAIASAIGDNRAAVPVHETHTSQTKRIAARVNLDPASDLARSFTLRVADLIEYQNATYAFEYADFVERVRYAESTVSPDSAILTEAVAKNLYKLMAYKDEYEVARLALDPAFAATVADMYGKKAKLSIRLHPPVLRAMGMKRKMSLGSWARPAFRVLRQMRWLRGTGMDIFGYSNVRRTERALIGEYREAIEAILPQLTAQTIASAGEIASLPDMVRGYEHVKTENVKRYRDALSRSLAMYATPVEASQSVG